MGSELDFNDQTHQHYIKAVNHLKSVVFFRLIRPWTYITFMFHILTKEGRIARRALQTVREFTDKIIEIRQKKFENKEENFIIENLQDISNLKKHLTVLDLLLREKIMNGNISDKEIREELNTFIFGVSNYFAHAITNKLR